MEAAEEAEATAAIMAAEAIADKKTLHMTVWRVLPASHSMLFFKPFYSQPEQDGKLSWKRYFYDTRLLSLLCSWLK